MDMAHMKLDGNAIGGLLREVFTTEVTVARATCGSCGAVREIGEVMVYAKAPGAVGRCPGCDAVLLRIVRTESRVWLELQGISCLELPASA